MCMGAAHVVQRSDEVMDRGRRLMSLDMMDDVCVWGVRPNDLKKIAEDSIRGNSASDALRWTVVGSKRNKKRSGVAV